MLFAWLRYPVNCCTCVTNPVTTSGYIPAGHLGFSQMMPPTGMCEMSESVNHRYASPLLSGDNIVFLPSFPSPLVLLGFGRKN